MNELIKLMTRIGFRKSERKKYNGKNIRFLNTYLYKEGSLKYTLYISESYKSINFYIYEGKTPSYERYFSTNRGATSCIKYLEKIFNSRLRKRKIEKLLA